MNPSEPTVFLVDDDFDTRCGLQAIIGAMRYVVRPFASAREFLANYQPTACGCLILDVRMPRQSGLDLYAKLLDDGSRLPVIFVTGAAQTGVVVEAMRMGAVDVLDKPVDPLALQASIQKALRMGAHWRKQDGSLRRIEARMAQLSSREQETLDLIVAGCSNKVMAEKLFISERAVEMRRAGMLKKLGLDSTTDLLNLAITHRVLTDLHASTPNNRV